MPCKKYKSASQRALCYATQGFKRKPRRTAKKGTTSTRTARRR